MHEKKYYRNLAIEKRSLITYDEIIEKSRIISEQILSMPYLEKSQHIFCYLSSKEKKEVNTDIIIKSLLSKNKNVYIPGTNWKEKKINIYNIKKFPIESNKFIMKYGIYEPIDKYFIKNSGVDLNILILPGTAGDASGTRYGYGSGFFDKLLLELKKIKIELLKILPLFDCQLFPELPREEHDIPVDIIVTESKVIYTSHCSNSKPSIISFSSFSNKPVF
ncbi:MAG: 5-formyltetrahydrofolate cyclo-ligase [Candidatus Firestonebacteria bacterium]|nr:5-formyltetrahydrofolate cyclo-ligase [Candidatus Firestonebacteria bacterium]